jgi:PPOX class probable F420-dependent enzyme
MTTPNPQLERFVRQPTVLLTTYKRDGTPVGTPVNLAVEGDHAYFRTWDTSWKARRLRRNHDVQIAPSTVRGEPTGDALEGTVRQLDGQEARHAAERLTRKYPVLHGVVVPLSHRLTRRKTVHYEFRPR